MNSTAPIQPLKAAARFFSPLAIAVLGVVAALVTIYEINHRFFFVDDRQTQYFPYGLIIKDMLLRGQFPFVTTRTFFGGALWLDPQNGIYNPLAMIMTMLIDPAHLEVSGLLYAIVLNILLTTGAYTLGRAYGIRPSFAALLGLMAGINLYTLYINSADWHPAASSMGWLMFAWAALKRLQDAEKNICWHILGSAILIYLLVSSGWPHNVVALAVVMTIMFLNELRNSRRHALRLVWAGALGAALCLPVVVPIIMALPFTSRPVGLATQGLFTPKPTDLLNFSNPAWFPDILWFAPGQHMSCPLFFTAWYALPLLALVDMRNLKWPKEILFVMGGLIMLTTEAAQLGPLRFPMRWLPDVQICLLLSLFCATEKSAIRATWPRMLLAFGALCLTTLAAIVNNPPVAMDNMSLVFLAAIFIAMLPPMAKRFDWLPMFLGITSIVMVLVMVARIPPFLDLGKNNKTPAVAMASESRVAYTLYSGHYLASLNPKDETEYLPGASAAYYGVNSFIGYSSLAYKGWGTIFGCATVETPFCVVYVSTLLQRAPETGVPYLDLLKIDTVVAQKGISALDASVALRHWSWRDTPNTVRLERPQPRQLPGTVSWYSQGVSTKGSAQLKPDGEELAISNARDTPGLIAFARLYFPGFRAFLDGRELNVRPVDELVVGVDIPPHAKGRLILTFLPPMFVPCLTLAMSALLCWMIAVFFEKRVGPRLIRDMLIRGKKFAWACSRSSASR